VLPQRRSGVFQTLWKDTYAEQTRGVRFSRDFERCAGGGGNGALFREPQVSFSDLQYGTPATIITHDAMQISTTTAVWFSNSIKPRMIPPWLCGKRRTTAVTGEGNPLIENHRDDLPAPKSVTLVEFQKKGSRLVGSLC